MHRCHVDFASFFGAVLLARHAQDAVRAGSAVTGPVSWGRAVLCPPESDSGEDHRGLEHADRRENHAILQRNAACHIVAD
jgi:hypothetical protein